MTTLTRWKLACALFAGVAGVATVKAHHGAPSNKPAATVTSARGGSLPSHIRRPMRVSPEAAGVSKEELVATMFSSRSVRDIQQVAAKLGAVGDDSVIDQIAPLLSDPRRGVPEAVLGVMGTIGTEHAVEELVSYTKDHRPSVRNAAVSALGSTQSVKAEQLLVELAQRGGDPVQTTAISALGSLASDRAVAVLHQLAKGADYSAAQTATYALGAVS
ncbi:MAG: HEAT repeat domain-containing protein, partial [Kofleriaceae bacterium]